MKELAAGTVRAIQLFVEALALLRLVIARHVSPLFELVGSVCK